MQIIHSVRDLWDIPEPFRRFDNARTSTADGTDCRCADRGEVLTASFSAKKRDEHYSPLLPILIYMLFCEY